MIKDSQFFYFIAKSFPECSTNSEGIDQNWNQTKKGL